MENIPVEALHADNPPESPAEPGELEGNISTAFQLSESNFQAILNELERRISLKEQQEKEINSMRETEAKLQQFLENKIEMIGKTLQSEMQSISEGIRSQLASKRVVSPPKRQTSGELGG